jgi:hypothetical protein
MNFRPQRPASWMRYVGTVLHRTLCVSVVGSQDCECACHGVPRLACHTHCFQLSATFHDGQTAHCKRTYTALGSQLHQNRFLQLAGTPMCNHGALTTCCIVWHKHTEVHTSLSLPWQNRMPSDSSTAASIKLCLPWNLALSLLLV